MTKKEQKLTETPNGADVKQVYLSKEFKEKIEQQFIDRCKAQFIKYKSKAYYKEQASFFSGVITALYITQNIEVNTHWATCCMSDREIVKY